MTPIKRHLLALILFLCPTWVLAAALELRDTSQIFAVSTTDASKRFLEMIFGTVGPILHGTSGMFLGAVFKVFNLGIIVVAGIFVIWSTANSLVNTAAEGKFMGGQGKPGWLIMRTIGGFALLTPSFTTGYSTIQVFVMWVVVQGAGFANAAWSEALDYLQGFGSVLAEPMPDVRGSMDVVGTILQMQVCMYYHEKLEKEKRDTAVAAGGVPAADAAFFPKFKVYDNGSAFLFPSSRYNEETDNGCGQLSYYFGDSSSQRAVGKIIKDATSVVIAGIDPAAEEIADVYGIYNPTQARAQREKARGMTVPAVIGAAADWINLTLPLGATARVSDTKDKGPAEEVEGDAGTDTKAYDMTSEAGVKVFFEDAKKLGWIYAGSYYYALGKLQGDKFEKVDTKPPIQAPPLGYNSLTGDNYIEFGTPLNEFEVFRGNPTTPEYVRGGSVTDDLAGLYDSVVTYIRIAKFEAMQQAEEDTTLKVGFEQDVDWRLVNYLGPVRDRTNTGLETYTAKRNAAVDPIMKLKAMGDIMMIIGFVAMIFISVAVFGISAGISGLSIVNPLPYAYSSLVSFFLPIFFALIGFIWSQGTMLAVYVPMIPFVVYSFTAIGWFAAVIEAMVAAPIVALGMTHPEGHDLLGAATQSMMLLLSVFLRPILMIIGLIAGMVLSRIGLQYLQMGFLVITKTSGMITLLNFIALWCVFISLIITLVHVAYNLIHEIPDRVMHWIGVAGSSSASAVSGALGGAKSAAAESSKAITGAFQKGVGGLQAQLKARERKHQRDHAAYKQADSSDGASAASDKDDGDDDSASLTAGDSDSGGKKGAAGSGSRKNSRGTTLPNRPPPPPPPSSGGDPDDGNK